MTRAVVLSCIGRERRLALEPGERALVGRSLDARVFLNDPSVSRRHCTLVATDAAIELEPIPGARSVLDGREVQAPAPVRDGALLVVGDLQLELRLVQDAPPGPARAAPRPAAPAGTHLGLRHADGRFFPLLRPLVIGSGRGSSLRLADAGVASVHAVLRVTRTGIELEDVGSPSGTRVNGHRAARHLVAVEDVVQLGDARLVVEARPTAPAGSCERCGAEAVDPSRRCGGCSRRTTRGRRRGGDRGPAWLEGYRVCGVLGSGSQGCVYELEDRATRGRVAAKRLWAPSGRAVERLLREVQALRQLEHPHIVRLVGTRNTRDGPVLLLEHVAGPSLSARLEAGAVEPRQAVTWGVQLARALAHAHAAGVTHRDVKPSNVLLAPDGAAKLTDFGLAALREASPLTRDGQRVGTPSYMSPEQARGGPIDGRADVWGLGATLFHALTGRPPFVARDERALLHLLEGAPVDLSPLARVASPAVTAALARLLARDGAERPSADAAATLLEEALAAEARPAHGPERRPS